jgi:hypothetical protein
MPAKKTAVDGPFDRDLNRETKEVQLLAWILAELKLQTRLLHKINDSILLLLPEPAEVDGFTITQTGDSSMPLTAPDPGNTLVFTATPTPAGAVLPAGVVPTWTSSDPTLAPVTVDPTGLIGTVVLDPSIPVGESVTLTVTATLPDGTTPTGSVSFTVGAPPPPEVTGFTVIQTA